MTDWIAGFIGILGVVIGLIGNEFLRRQRRVEAFSSCIFEKRLEAYEELVRRMHEANQIATDVMENPAYSPEERHSLLSEAILHIAEFTDRSELYLDEELSVHCVAAFMGAEDVYETEDMKDKEELRLKVLSNYKNARRMIREDSGVAEVDTYIKKVAKPELDSPVISYLRELKQQHNLNNQS